MTNNAGLCTRLEEQHPAVDLDMWTTHEPKKTRRDPSFHIIHQLDGQEVQVHIVAVMTNSPPFLGRSERCNTWPIPQLDLWESNHKIQEGRQHNIDDEEKKDRPKNIVIPYSGDQNQF